MIGKMNTGKGNQETRLTSCTHTGMKTAPGLSTASGHRPSAGDCLLYIENMLSSPGGIILPISIAGLVHKK